MIGNKHSNKYNEFINKHRHAIEIMKEYKCLSNLTVISYNLYGNKIPNLAEDYFYEIIRNNVDNLEKIEKLLLKLQSLGFKTISYNEDLDFTKYNYNLDVNTIESSISFTFLENIKILPTYLIDPITYNTTDSKYCMYLEKNNNSFTSDEEISKYRRKIYLNDLTFDIDRLPDEISCQTTFDIILNKSKSIKNDCSAIYNSLAFSTGIDNLKEQYESLQKVINNIDSINNKDELINIMHSIQELLKTLKQYSKTYEKEITENSNNITPSIIESNKKLYLERRYFSGIDND